MDAAVKAKVEDKFVTAEGLRIRYLEEGEGPPVLLFHGASLGSSADVWRRNLAPLAAAGVRAIAFDQPGFGLSDDPSDWGMGFRTNFVLKFMDAMGLTSAAMVGHSQAGAIAVNLALNHPDRVSKVMVLGTGSLLPPLPVDDAAPKKAEPVEGQEGGDSEPTLAESRAILEKNLFNPALITDEELAVRHKMSLGKNLKAFLSRNQAAASNKGGGAKSTPLWQRLPEVKQPLIMIFGREDRGQAAKRFAIAHERWPQLDMHLVPSCKHLVQWDAFDTFHKLAGPFLRG